MSLEHALRGNTQKISRRIKRPEAAEYLGLAESTLAKMAMTGDGPEMIRVGKRSVVYDTDALDRYLAKRVRRSTNDDGSRAFA